MGFIWMILWIVILVGVLYILFKFFGEALGASSQHRKSSRVREEEATEAEELREELRRLRRELRELRRELEEKEEK